MIVFAGYSAIDLSSYDRINNKLLFDKEMGHAIRFYGSDVFVSGMAARLQLFDIAWRQIKQKPITGLGLHTYKYIFSRDQKAPYINSQNRFVHNDYLQLWMEIGVPGVTLFIALFIVPVYLLFRLSDEAFAPDKTKMLAVIASLASMYAHALVDFIFYVPFLLLMLACGLGLFNQIVSKYYQNLFLINISNRYLRFNLTKSLAAVISICLLSHPVIAQLAYAEAINRKNVLDFKGTLSYLEMARQFAPYESDYYWYEAALLMTAVKSEQDKASAKRADELFASGMAVNTYAAKNRLARAELHRDYGYLLSKPEDLNVVLSWNEEALYWSPNDPVLQIEYVKTLIAIGEYDRAKRLLADYIWQSPKPQYTIEMIRLLQKLDRNIS